MPAYPMGRVRLHIVFHHIHHSSNCCVATAVKNNDSGSLRVRPGASCDAITATFHESELDPVKANLLSQIFFHLFQRMRRFGSDNPKFTATLPNFCAGTTWVPPSLTLLHFIIKFSHRPTTVFNSPFIVRTATFHFTNLAAAATVVVVVVVVVVVAAFLV